MSDINNNINNNRKEIDLELPCLAKIAQQMPSGFFIYRADETREILYVNDILLDIFGCANLKEFRELTGGNFTGLVYPEDREAVEKSITEQVAENKRHLDYVEYRIKRKDGAIRWVDDYGRLTHTKDKGDIYYVLIRDITELHEFRIENMRRAEVIEGLSVDFKSIYLVNLETGTMRPYRMQSEYFMAIASELGGADDQPANWDLILPTYAERYVIDQDRERFLKEISGEEIRRRLTLEKSYTVEYRCRDVNHEDEIIYMQMSVILSEHDQIHAVVGYRDITEQTRRVQRELREKLNMELELERERNMNEIKSSFLFNLSHDLRTPMNAVMGYTELAKRHARDAEKLNEYLELVSDSSRHMLDLIDDLLEMNKIDGGRIEAKSEICNLKEQIDITLNLFRARAEQKNIILREDLNLPDESVLTDTSRFRRVMGNLIDNAIKFTPENGLVKISARKTRESESGYARYEFEIADTGIGMTDEFMKRMYQAFEREASSTKSGSTGTGLGLSIAKSILDVMGGSISARSEKGKGSVFIVDLPLKIALKSDKQDKQDNINNNINPDKQENNNNNQEARRILLVEDIELNRMLAETILEEAGFEVESAPDGCDAVEMFANHPEWHYDLILMDIQMPVMNGYEATRAIRALNRVDAKAIPIIALSANARDEDKRMSLESGMNHHIAKPFDVEQLISTIAAHTMARN